LNISIRAIVGERQAASISPQLPALARLMSPLRLWRVQDAEGLWGPLMSSLRRLLSGAEGGPQPQPPAEVLVLGDGPLLPLLAAAAAAAAPGSGASVVWLQDAGPWQRWVEAAATSSSLPAVVVRPTQAPGAHFTAAAATASGPEGAPPASLERPRPLVVVSEPYFHDLEGQLPWFRLRFWQQLDQIR
jgi:hypothetical protein